MKTLIGPLLFLLSALVASGQSVKTPLPAMPPMPPEPKVIAEISAGANRIVKGSPFSAEAVSESVQMLADGNRITRKTTASMYRDSQGRTRREESLGAAALRG